MTAQRLEAKRRATAKAAADLEDFVLLLFHTGTRDHETSAMRWTDVDLERAIWTIPSEMSKNGKPHEVALSSGAIEVLKRRSPFGVYVFPDAESETGYIDRPESKVFRSIAIAAGLLRNVGTERKPEWEGEALHLHDIRRTIGDRVKQEFGAAMMHVALGHADKLLTQTYGPTPPRKERAKAMEWWAGEFRRILGVAVAEERA